jgi:hypothetical protein
VGEGVEAVRAAWDSNVTELVYNFRKFFAAYSDFSISVGLFN